MGGHAFACCFCDSLCHLLPILRNKLGVVWQLCVQGNWQCFPLLGLSKARDTEDWVRIGHNIDQFNLVFRSVQKAKNNTTLVPIPHHCVIKKQNSRQECVVSVPESYSLGRVRRWLALPKQIFLRYAKTLRQKCSRICIPQVFGIIASSNSHHRPH